jgi:hypothetical protein
MIMAATFAYLLVLAFTVAAFMLAGRADEMARSQRRALVAAGRKRAARPLPGTGWEEAGRLAA